MKFSNLLVPTLKEDPKDAEVISHKLMTRAGMIRKTASGIYTLLPLGLKIIRKFEQIVREELNSIGAQEILMPAVIPADLWIESGRWDLYGKELLRIKDRNGKEFCFGPTHEEVVTDIARTFIKSYRQLPVTFYQIQTKFRDEIRPRFGLMRCREFGMKDAYSFSATPESLDAIYEDMRAAYCRIFERCGLKFKMVAADSGAIGGSVSAEFMVTAETGEDAIIECTSCDYAANIEAAESRLPATPTAENTPIEKVDTPGAGTIDEVSTFLKVPSHAQLKTLIYSADNQWVALVVRGDHELNVPKAKRALGCDILVPADEAAVRGATGANFGSIGPVGLTFRIVIDRDAAAMPTAIAGANENGFHLKGIVPSRDLKNALIADIRNAMTSEPCVRCTAGTYRKTRGIEVGHIFKLGDKYSKAMSANILDANGKSVTMIMGCYGIGIGRTVAAAIEQQNDESGIIWPAALAPFTVDVISTSLKDASIVRAADQLYADLLNAGIDVLYDDRDMGPGMKFKDADLIGIPFQVIVGKSFLTDGTIEIKKRATGERSAVPLADVLTWIQNAS